MKIHAAFLAAGILAAALAPAATPVGAWTGKFVVKMPPMPANMPPAQKEMAMKAITQIKNGKILLTMKANKTYTMKAIGLPMFGKPDNLGTWTQTGNTVMIKETKAGAKAQPFVLSPDGKKMIFKLPGGQGQLTFSR